MKINKYKCDFCGAELNGKPYATLNGTIMNKINIGEDDLCSQCLAKVYNLILENFPYVKEREKKCLL
jgi:hypothetical protein